MLIVVSGTCNQTYITVGDRSIRTGVVGLRLVVQQQSAYVMVAKRAVVVEACLSIPVTVRPCRLTITRIPVVTGTLINDFAILCEIRTERSRLTTCTVLCLPIRRVVRSLYTEIQSLGQEIHVQFVDDIGIQHVSRGKSITLTIERVQTVNTAHDIFKTRRVNKISISEYPSAIYNTGTGERLRIHQIDKDTFLRTAKTVLVLNTTTKVDGEFVIFT